VFGRPSPSKRSSSRRRPARDSASPLSTLSRITCFNSVACGNRPARDTRPGSAPSPLPPRPEDRRRARLSRWRQRSSTRCSRSSRSRRRLARRLLRIRRHCPEHVFCVASADGAGRYHRRHTQHLLHRTHLFPLVIQQRWRNEASVVSVSGRQVGKLTGVERARAAEATPVENSGVDNFCQANPSRFS